MLRNLSKSDLWSGLLWILLGIFLCVGSIKLRLGNLHKPGAGFLPFLSGTFIGLLGLILILLTFFKKGGDEEVPSKTSCLKENWGKFFVTLFVIVGYIVFFKTLGFILTTFLFLLLLFKLTDPRRWGIPLILSGGVVFLSYLLFSVWLKCPFPRGILNF